MTTQQWIDLVDQLPDYARVTFTGGEPFAFKGFKDVYSHVAKRKLDCNIITNGTLLNEPLIDFLLTNERLRVLSISIDSVGNTVRDVKKRQWARAEDMIRLFSKKKKEFNHDCVLEAKTVILDAHAEEILNIHKYCLEDLKVDHHTYQFLKGSPIQHADYMFEFDAIFKEYKAPTYKKFEVIQEQLKKVQEYNLKNNTFGFLHPKIATLTENTEFGDLSYINHTGLDSNRFKPCMFPWSSVHINTDGSLFPCMAVEMGNVKETPLKEIITGPKFKKFKEVLRKGLVGGCNRCGWLRPN